MLNHTKHAHTPTERPSSCCSVAHSHIIQSSHCAVHLVGSLPSKTPCTHQSEHHRSCKPMNSCTADPLPSLKPKQCLRTVFRPDTAHAFENQTISQTGLCLMVGPAPAARLDAAGLCCSAFLRAASRSLSARCFFCSRQTGPHGGCQQQGRHPRVVRCSCIMCVLVLCWSHFCSAAPANTMYNSTQGTL